MKRVALVALALVAAPLFAHVGSPGSVYDGNAGPYPVRVIVRAPSVVPGLAEITIRTPAPGITRVTVKPVKWDAGTAGSPPADDAKRVSGDPGLYSASLWLMSRGAYSVYVGVEGPHGPGRAIVPINAVATSRLPMPRELGAVLMFMALLLAAGVVSIFGAGVREAIVAPGVEPDAQRRRGAGWVMAVSALLVILIGAYGKFWWGSVDQIYRQTMYKPLAVKTTLAGNTLELAIEHQEWRPGDGRATPLIPEHGKLMHLFLISDSKQVIAHLHPLFAGRDHFRGTVPPLPPGDYRLFADVTHESGFAETLVDKLHVAAQPQPAPPSDPDDSAAHVADPRITFLNKEPLRANRDTGLRFAVRGGPIEPYMGMAGHAVIVANDFSVFVHLHPMGTISMASQQKFAQRDGSASQAAMVMSMPPAGGVVNFPYSFPKPGAYRVWVQTKVNGEVITGMFDLNVGE